MTVIPKALFDSVGKDTPLKATKQTLRGPGHQLLPVKEYFTGTLKWGSQEVEEDVYVVRRLRRPLLGRPAIEALGLIKQVASVQLGSDTLLEHFPELFQGLGKLQREYHICFKDEARPFALTTP